MIRLGLIVDPRPPRGRRSPVTPRPLARRPIWLACLTLALGITCAICLAPPAVACWPQACAADWAAYPPAVWVLTLVGAVLCPLLAIAPFAALAWVATLATRAAPHLRARLQSPAP